MDRDEDLEEFLRSRQVSEGTIIKFQEEKIDSKIILLMTEENLASFLPKYGDRIAVKEYCNKKHDRSSRKQSLLEKLRKKIRKSKGSSSEEESSTKKIKSGNWKDTRQIELGWLCSMNGDRYVHVRTKQGGGTRKVHVPKNANKSTILQKAKDLFFPNNMSSKGSIEKFSIQLWDFKSNVINEDFTIEEMYMLSGLSRLRLYLATKEKCATISSNINSTDVLELSLPTSETNSTELAIIASNSQTNKENDFYSELIHDTIFIDQEPISQYMSSAMDPVPSSLISLEFGTDTITNMQFSNSVEIILHRGHVFDELINHFCVLDKNCSNLNIKMLLSNGDEEKGVDNGGIFRDALSEFWNTFYSKCTVGTVAKIPYIRHDFNYSKWNAIAKILYKGWIDLQYFPLELSCIFMEYCINGQVQSDILENFFNFLSQNEADTIKNAITSFENVDSEEINEVMSNLECKLILNKNNIETVIKDIAHKEMIQKPMYVIDCWHIVLSGMLSIEQLHDIYKKQNVSSKNVLGILSYSNNLNAEENKIIGFLKKFIRETDINKLKLFLRFCTGADIITNNNILVNFVNKDGFSRVPVAHTCGCVLELPLSYDNFPEFRSEMESILLSNIWVMDFI